MTPTVQETLGPRAVVEVAPYSRAVKQDEIILLITYDAKRSHELVVGLLQDEQTDSPFELADILRVTTCPPALVERLALVQTDQVEVLEKFLTMSLEALTTYATPFFWNNQGAYDRAARAGRREPPNTPG